ncbi:MAG: hypothetical protein NZM25_01010 [Leptospiraceae bacterium]|nr:hypothetical protein [Leptospiraceae bacterium]MDW8306303.1 hypothetical protein [Leptospiraceae bacterium]
MATHGRFLTLKLFVLEPVLATFILIPMDRDQLNHLQAYGAVYQMLDKGYTAEVLLNFRGGSFLLEESEALQELLHRYGISWERFGEEDLYRFEKQREKENLERLKLEKAPRIAIYKPPGTDPWDDAVQLVLDFAQIRYDTLYDEEVLRGELSRYDWLHLHHEDFTGQYGKFYGFARNQEWYQERRLESEELARKLGFSRVPELKKEVALAIQDYVSKGGFLFAMCSATDSLDIALAAQNIDIVDPLLDHTPVTDGYQKKLDFNKTLAFYEFQVITDPFIYEFSDIDINPQEEGIAQSKDFFTLFEFNAKTDPIPTLLTQNHVRQIRGFLGQTTAFRLSKIKPRVLILGQTLGSERVKYIYGSYGRGFFSFYGGHDPEDYQHLVGDPPTDLRLYKNSPGYRLILNNIFMPAAQPKKQKT